MKRTLQPIQNKSTLNQLKTESCRIIRAMLLFFIIGIPALAQQSGAEAVSSGSHYNLEQENVLSCELIIPNGFSPNNDGIQDTWRIKCIENYPNARVEVFNRWGNLVFEKENYGNIDLHGPADAWWDGRSTHKWTLGKDILPAGTYFYILDLKDGSKPRNGFLYLNR